MKRIISKSYGFFFLSMILLLVFMAGFSIASEGAEILMVDDFSNPPMDWKAWWKEAFKKSKKNVTFASVDEINKPGHQARLRLEDFQTVIWHTGLDEKNTLEDADRTVIAQYLEQGGQLFLLGTEIASDLIHTGQRWFLKRYLRCDFLMPNSPIIEGSVFEYEPLEGLEKSIFKGLEFSIDHGEFDAYPVDSPNLIYEDYDPTAGGGGALHCVRFQDIPGNLGIQFEGPVLPGCPPCRIVFLTFPLEAVFPEKSRGEMLERVMGFFAAPPKKFKQITGAVLTDPNSGKKTPLEGVLVSLKGTTFRTRSRKDGSYILSGVSLNKPTQQYLKDLYLFGWRQTSRPELLLSEMIPMEPIHRDTMEHIRPPLEEGRGIWIIRSQIKSPEAVKEIVERCHMGGFNALFVQVRGRGDAYYKSETEPRAERLKDQPEDFDPLAMFVELAHKRGMEVHAWMNAFYTYEGQNEPYAPKHILSRHPEWVLTNRAGKSLMEYTREELREHHSEGVYLSPCVPETRAYLAEVYLEVVKNYDVDGIHFDFIRFCHSDNRITSDWDLGYNPLARKAFKKKHGVDPMEIDPKNATMVKTWNDWRRSCVSSLVADVHERAHKIKPKIRVSAAVLERYHLARGCHCHQDWIGWMKNGWIDTCCIMSYRTDNELVGKRIRMAVENSGDATVWAGLSGNWKYDRTGGALQSMLERVEIVRRQKPEGILFFAYKHFSDEDLEALKQGPFSIPAVPPKVR